MTEQKPHWINLTCMKCGYRYSGLTHAAPSACPNDGESLVPYDPPAQRIASLEAELAQVKAERDAERDGWNAEKLGHADSITKWSSAERLCRELAVGLGKIAAKLSISTTPDDPKELLSRVLRMFEALLSRPEVVNLLEKEKA